MDWNVVETFLKESVWGMVILGALGSGLYILIMKVFSFAKSTIRRGRDNTKKKIRNNRRERKRKAKLLLVSKNYRISYILTLIRSFYLFILFTMMITAFFNLSIQMAFGFFIGFTFDVILELSFLKRIYNKLSKREIGDKGYNIPL